MPGTKLLLHGLAGKEVPDLQGPDVGPLQLVTNLQCKPFISLFHLVLIDDVQLSHVLAVDSDYLQLLEELVPCGGVFAVYHGMYSQTIVHVF